MYFGLKQALTIQGVGSCTGKGTFTNFSEIFQKKKETSFTLGFPKTLNVLHSQRLNKSFTAD